MEKEFVQKLQKTAVSMRMDLLEMFGCDGMRSGHWGGSSSICEVMAALYFYKMKYDPQNPDWPERDYLIMSKGHSVPAQYAALTELGCIDRKELKTFKHLGSILTGHPEMDKTPGIEANTGSLGMGLSIGLGISLGKRLDGDSNKVYVIIGDGELDEGQVWEAAMAISAFKLNNIRVIVDCNNVQASGPLEKVMPSGSIRSKWEAFGWHVIDVDGHDIESICGGLDEADTIEQPVVILAHTVKGKGVSFAENNASYHNYVFTPEAMDKAKAEIKEWLEKF